jgi:biotin carboxyl carrier protein
MDFEFSHGGNLRTVNIETDKKDKGEPDGFIVSFGEKEYRFNATRVSPNCFSLLLDGRNMSAYIGETEKNLYVHINGQAVKLDKVKDDRNSFAGDAVEFVSKDEISTPMPGKVVKVLVKEGEKVRAKQSLVIVESMKMENEIKSPTDGKVKSIHFEPGDLVKPGQPIIKLTPVE